MTEPISLATLQGMLLDIDIPDAQLRPYLMESAEESTPLNPVVKINPATVVAHGVEGAMLLGSLNGVARWRRHQRYRRKIKDWQGVRIVSEGDSWFQFPLLLDDVIDCLFDANAIFSLDAAGDLVSDMVKQNELVSAVVQEKPDVVLLSGGGNDVLGGGRLAKLLPPFAPGRPAERYLGEAFDANLRQVMRDYETLLDRLAAVAPATPVICHTYDHAIPANGRWLGRPLASIGIVNAALQRAIVQLIVDRFHDELVEMAGKRQGIHAIHVVDCRRTVNGRWHDELHPDNRGYRAVAALFSAMIAKATGKAGSGVEGAMPEAAVPPDRSLTGQALALAAAHPDEVLFREIGRLKVLAAAGGSVADEPVLVYASSVEGTYPDHLEIGRGLAAVARRKVAGSFCGAEAAEAAILADAARDGQAALAAAVASQLKDLDDLPAAAVALLAALLVRQLPGDPAGICGAWTNDGSPAVMTRASTQAPRESGPTTPARLLSQLRVPDASSPAGDAGRAAEPVIQPAERTRYAREALEYLAKSIPGIDRSIVDRLLKDGEAGLQKLENDGERAKLNALEIKGAEAIIKADGSRPALFVQRDDIDLSSPALSSPLAKPWLALATEYHEGIKRVVNSVGAIQLPAFGNSRIGTAFAVAPGVVLTNRHVLEMIADFDNGAWRWKYNAEIEFEGEFGRVTENRFALESVVACGPHPINGRIDFDLLDFALLKVRLDHENFPPALPIHGDERATVIGFGQTRSIYTVGFPAEPFVLPSNGPSATVTAPPAGYDYEDVLRKLFENRYGHKRWAPGYIEAGAGQLAQDANKWVMSHDATTLGGSSGSCVVDFTNGEALVVGLHFGGAARSENWAHVLAALRTRLAVPGMIWQP